MLFGNLKISFRLFVIVAIAVLGIVAVSGYGLSQLKSNLLEDRAVKTRHLVESAVSLIDHYRDMEAKGELATPQAQKAALAAMQSLRYDQKEYFWVQKQGVMLMHPIKPKLNGKNLIDFADPTGKRLFAEMERTVADSGAGFVEYMWPKPGSEAPVAKVSYVAGVKDWGWVVGSGIYLDDVDAIFQAELTVIGGVSLLIALIVAVGSAVIARGITVPLGGIADNMLRLADGDRSIDVPYTDNKSELGALARAMAVFKEKTEEMESLRREQEREKIRHEEERRDIMTQVANDFQRNVGGIVAEVSSASGTLQTTAKSMSVAASETSRQSEAVSKSAEGTSSNVQTVAAAAEELSASIREIGRQVNTSTEIASRASVQAARTSDHMNTLNGAADRIGEVIGLITDIADQTNLLALNATIEAARAGEAGKGFAVVASEVKNLANQTAKATSDISEQVTSIQALTKDAVSAISEVDMTISEVSEIASAIAAAVEQQGAATQEITRSVEEAANGTRDVTTHVGEVARVASETGSASQNVLTSAERLSENAVVLRTQVDEFIHAIRPA